MLEFSSLSNQRNWPAKLLFIAKEGEDMFSLIGFESAIWAAGMHRKLTYPRDRKAAVAFALAEACAWLEAQGLIVPAHADDH
jgi:hypothetical protein